MIYLNILELNSGFWFAKSTLVAECNIYFWVQSYNCLPFYWFSKVPWLHPCPCRIIRILHTYKVSFLSFYIQIIILFLSLSFLVTFLYILINWYLFSDSFSLFRVLLLNIVTLLIGLWSRPRARQIQDWRLPSFKPRRIDSWLDFFDILINNWRRSIVN